jgi:predicted  nucleic acid-binding Zn-ribbon protein
MIESSTEKIFPKDNNVKIEQTRSQNDDKMVQKSLTNETGLTNIQLSRQIKDLDKKNTRIEELLSSIKKDIKNAVLAIKDSQQLTSDGATRMKELHDQFAKLQMQTQKIEQVITDGSVSKKSKKDKKDKKQNNKEKDKKSKKKAKSLKKKQK